MKHIDSDRLLQNQIEQYKLDEFKAQSAQKIQEMPTYNLQFATVEQTYKRPVVPMKQVKYVNKIMGTERLVKAPDIEIDGVSSYRMQYFK